MTAADRLAIVEHTLGYYPDETDDCHVLTATHIIDGRTGQNDWTGITMGDLRGMAAALQAVLALADRWAVLSGAAMDRESREWTAAASASVRKVIEEAL